MDKDSHQEGTSSSYNPPSADKAVVIWSNQGEGLLKYSHSESIQALSYNPVLNSLASCSTIDFGLWSTDQPNVNKHKLVSKALCCDWSPDGQVLAIGLYNGTILLKDKTGAELTEIKREEFPIWTVRFCPQKFDSPDNVLSVGSWDQKLS